MFGLFSSTPYYDQQFGELRRSRGHWRGSVALDVSTQVPLVLSGSRSAPDALALGEARELITRHTSWRAAIENALFEHYEPGAEAVAAGEHEVFSKEFPKISTPSQIWPHVSLVYAAVTSMDGIMTTELGYTAEWDEEHTLGARFRSGNFVELCGSTLPP